jgi:PAS domain S-box-containing protein
MLPYQQFTRVGPYRLIVVLLAIVFLTESGKTFRLPAILTNRPSEWVQASIDALLLVLILAPTVWWLMIRPLRDGHEKAESRFRDLVEFSPDGVLAVDRRGLIRLANGQVEAMFGYSRTELVGQPVEMLMPGTIRARHVADRTQFQRQPRLRPMGTGRDLQALRKDGSEFPVDVSLSPVPRDGEPLVIAIVRDLTKRQETERALRESEQRYRAVVQHIDEIVYAVETTADPSAGRVLFVSDRVEHVTGHTSQEFLENPQLWSSLIHPDDVSSVASLTDRLLSERVSVTRLYRLRDDRTGHYLWIEDRVAPYVAGDGALVTLFGVARDVTERRRAEVALRQSEADLKEAQRVGKLGSWEWNAKTDTITWSVEYYRIYGCDPKQRPPGYEEHLRLYTAESAARLSAAVERAMQTGAPYELALEQARTDGTKAWITARGEVTRDASGQIVGLRGTAQDITDRKRSEDVLRQANTRLQNLSRRLLTIQETERRSLARELHDEIGQALTATKINLQALERFPNPAMLASRLRDANSIVERALEQVRSLSLELRPPLLDDLGLPAALRWLLDQHARRSGLGVQFVSDAFEGRLAAEVETACFRIAQQGLTNVEKHAGARTVTVELRRVEDALHLHVRDDGAGFDVPAARARAMHGGSLGLLSMEERAALADGGIEWTSAPGCGTDVHAWFALALALAPTTRP